MTDTDPRQYADYERLRKVADDLYESLRNFRNRYWDNALVAGDDDWVRDALAAYRTLIDGDAS